MSRKIGPSKLTIMKMDLYPVDFSGMKGLFTFSRAEASKIK